MVLKDKQKTAPGTKSNKFQANAAAPGSMHELLNRTNEGFNQSMQPSEPSHAATSTSKRQGLKVDTVLDPARAHKAARLAAYTTTNQNTAKGSGFFSGSK